MKQYHKHLEKILYNGTPKKPARDGMPGSTSLFGYQNRYNLSKGLPLLTTKKVNFKHIVTELIWFLKGDTNIKYLINQGCNIWNQDAYNYYEKLCKKNNIIPVNYKQWLNSVKTNEVWKDNLPENYELGNCGEQYGKLWRDWNNQKVDQLEVLINGLIESPMSRRHIITAWNPSTLDQMALNACHCLVQFNIRPLSFEERMHIHNPKRLPMGAMVHTDEFLDEYNIPKYYLDCQMYQRSADMFLGVPYNIASYALLTEIISKICNMIPGEFIHSFGDSHIYDNHIEQALEILDRDPNKYKLPKLTIDYNLHNGYKNVGMNIFNDLNINHFDLVGYESYPPIKAELSTGLK